MNQRYGAWAQLLVLFRLFHDGADADGLHLPRRLGVLFDPDRFPFLEGRGAGAARQGHERIEPPLVPDGTVYRALDKLLVLDGERISYRALDVEQIGSVYETMMGFRVEKATGRSVAIKAQKKQGAPTTVDLEALLGEAGSKRAKWLRDRTDRTLTEKVRKPVAEAENVVDLHAALQPVIDTAATPDLVPAGAVVLQPSQARRRSGSHYTPRELTEPIVRTALEPILAQLRSPRGESPAPEAVLDLKVCDPAMGSGAFLVEACRQLGDALIDAWRAHDVAPAMAAGGDEVVVARRLIAQRCLYGVDRNPMAVDLAKVSLWLATLAKEHPLTFVDHALRHGDSLVGLSQRQIEAFHWEDGAEPLQQGIETIELRKCVERVAELRQRIRKADETVSDWDLRDWWDEARFELGKVRLFGDLVIAAFFEESKPKKRKAKRDEYAGAVFAGEFGGYRDSIEQCRGEDPPLAPFHWEIEFPEVFERAPSATSEQGVARFGHSRGFDAIVGNPPFAGKNSVAAGNVAQYPDWLKQVHAESHGNADLVAHFFRRAFHLVRELGAFGLIATNTIAQGDTRASGLRWICNHGGEIFSVRRRAKWPGLAAVVVSVIHIGKGPVSDWKRIDGRDVERITAFLFHRGGHDDPARLAENAGKSFQGSIVLGMGFTFDDTDTKGVASSLSEMRRLIEKNPRNQEVIFPYIGGHELNTSPTHAHHRYVINFGDYPSRRVNRESDEVNLRANHFTPSAILPQVPTSWAGATKKERRVWLQQGEVPPDYPEPVAGDWPDLLAIIQERVKPERMAQKDRRAKLYWWQFIRPRPELHAAIAGLKRVLAISRISDSFGFTFLPTGMVYNEKIIIFPFEQMAALTLLQSRVHEIWARSFSSTLKDDLQYTPSDCLETFPFPSTWESNRAMEAVGSAYYEFRARLMIRNDEGLTEIYNRFHNRREDDPEIVKLRELHAAMDCAVLHAYGWMGLRPKCDCLPDEEAGGDEISSGPKSYRYHWPEETRQEILARLLELNAERRGREARVSGGRRPCDH